MQHMVKYFKLRKGDEFLIDGEVWTVIAIHMPGNGQVNIWARDPQEQYHTLAQTMQDDAYCPVYG